MLLLRVWCGYVICWRLPVACVCCMVSSFHSYTVVVFVSVSVSGFLFRVSVLVFVFVVDVAFVVI